MSKDDLGWICLHRSLLKWEWYDDINATRLFIHCLLRANHKDKQWRGIEIKRGQFWTSLDTLASETKLSPKQIRVAFSKLEKTNEVASKGHARGRMVTVLKYDEYQEEGKPKGRVRAKSGQAKGKLGATNNNDNNDNNDNNKPTWAIPDGINAKAWEEFEQHRKDIKKPMTDTARTKAANQIKNLTHEEQQATIDKTIQSRWTGLFPEKGNQGQLDISSQQYSDGPL